MIVPGLEPAAFGYVDTPLRKPPRPIKVEDAEAAAAAVRVAQPGPKVGERRALEDAGFGFVDTPLKKTIRSTIKLEPGLVPEPAQLEPGRGSEPAPQEQRAKKTICAHGRQKQQCKECGGSAICPHGRQKQQCKECGGSAFCAHGRRKQRCKECRNGGIVSDTAAHPYAANGPQALPNLHTAQLQ